ncbi:MAG TPA: transglycosylase SLT domain-containing protein [Longimicrobium sp.]|jgi:soluble lytic murein transglycosylase
MHYTQRTRLSGSFSAAAAIAGVVMGLAISTSWGEENVRRELRDLTLVPSAFDVDPLRGLTRAEMLAAVTLARSALADGRPWAAWTGLQPHVAEGSDAPPAVVLLAARAAAGWNGWPEVRGLLRGREWLAREGGAEGFLLLGRAEEAGGNWPRAADAYRRYARAAAPAERGVAYARLGRVLLRQGRKTEAGAAFARAAESQGSAADWYRALAVEAGHAVAATPALESGAGAAALARQARAEANVLAGRGAIDAAAERLTRAAAAAAQFDPTAAAGLEIARAGVLERARRGAEAREPLRRAAADARVEAATRIDAAATLGRLVNGRTLDEELARADAYEAGGRPGLAAKALRAALKAGAPDDPLLRLRMGRLLLDAGDAEPARAALMDAAARVGLEHAADAELLAARALLRAGKSDDGIAALKKVAERFPGTAAAAGAWFYLGDASSTRELAIANYRRGAAVRVGPYAREALFRAGDRALKNRDPALAATLWEEYATRYPTGSETSEVAYAAGVHHERAGRGDRAAALYRIALSADPVSYYAVRAADRLGTDVLADALRDPLPWTGLASDPAEAATALRRLDELERAGLDEPWKEELAAQLRRLERRPTATLLIAEGVRDRGHAVEGINIGRRLLAERGGRWDARLLRVVFPFPYQAAMVDAAERAKVDVYLLAAVVRQESSFDPRASSRVGATGLGQIMPVTGKWLAKSAGVKEFEERLLTGPEINARMSATYLRDQLRHYRGKRDLALAAYNAGPRNADRWKSELGYGRDVDAFRDRIPFPETREYVKVVLRNAAVYRRLYGGERDPGLVSGD